jgi:hypothetical protein
VGADSAEVTLGLSPVRYDDDDDSKDDNNFAAFFVNCSFTALFLLFFSALFALCAFFTFSFSFFFVLFVAVVVAVGAVAPASTKVGAPGYSPFRNLVL